MRRIKRLPEGVHSSVRSGVVICDLARVVEELVFNSLEAGATKVSVAVGVGSCYVKVADNGLGITRDELMLLGERYATSKVDHTSVKDPDTECLDFHGEALCSISHISLLEIVTKARGKPNGYKKIMKNCQCLFLGINDDIQDVGTTVTARDIFHNQPVRRKHMESSPKKVLDSIRMSVLRIALVHLNVSFKVVDAEGTGELLHTGPSPSPLPILFSNFGIENSGDFCELNVTDGLMKLSGYITGPRDIFSPKAIQYVYINSRFICKGPIHKLVNELATKFDLLNSLKPTTCSQSEKQNRCHMCPTFILNLNCPRSYYDIVTSERSRTSVEFQDWDLVLTFIENCVKRLWIENISHGILSVCHYQPKYLTSFSDCAVPKPTNACAINFDTPATCESGRKRCRKQNSQADLDLSSPQLKKPSKNYDNVPDWEECLSPMGKPSKISKLKKHQSEAGFLSETSSHLSPCRVFSPEHHQIVAYTSSKQEDGISSAALVDKLPKFDVNTSTRSGVSADYLEFSDDIDKDLQKSFLRSCSFQRSLHDRTPSDERLGFGSDGFRLTKEWANFDDSIVDEVKQVFCGREKHIDVSPPFQLSPITQFDKRERSKFPLVVIRNNMSDSYEQVQKLSSSQQCFPPVWSPISEEKIATIQEYDVIYENLIENHPEFGEDTIYKYSSWREHEDCIESNLNTRGSWQQQNDSFLNFSPYPKVCTYPKREIGEFRWGDFESSLSPIPSKRPRVIDWSLLPCYGEESPKIYSIPSLYGTTSMEPGCGRPYRRNQEAMYIRKKRSIRSNSAPPFHKGKKRYLNLSDSSVLSEKSNTQTISRTLFSKEPSNSNHAQHYAKTRNLKNLPKSSGQNQPSPKGKSVPDCSFSESPSFGRSQKEDQFNNTNSMECSELNDIKGSFDSGGKWPSHCSLSAGGHAPCINKDQDTILDISSSKLYLPGDSLVPTSIDKTSLEHAKVLNQVDKKFIAVVAGRTLAVIDQHAADERIRLEELRHKVLSGELKRITYLDDEKELVLPEIGYQLLHNYAEQIQSWGWICNIHSQNTSSFMKNLDFLHRQSTVVKLLAVPCILGVNLTDTDLLEFLQQLADTDGSSNIPPSVHYILNNKACRGAIMFGDALLASECSLLVEELKRTSQCFQCAHGRPTTVPLVNLDVLHKKIAKLASHKSWHGLHQHGLKLERTFQRLSSALC